MGFYRAAISSFYPISFGTRFSSFLFLLLHLFFYPPSMFLLVHIILRVVLERVYIFSFVVGFCDFCGSFFVVGGDFVFILWVFLSWWRVVCAFSFLPQPSGTGIPFNAVSFSGGECYLWYLEYSSGLMYRWKEFWSLSHKSSHLPIVVGMGMFR